MRRLEQKESFRVTRCHFIALDPTHNRVLYTDQNRFFLTATSISHNNAVSFLPTKINMKNIAAVNYNSCRDMENLYLFPFVMSSHPKRRSKNSFGTDILNLITIHGVVDDQNVLEQKKLYIYILNSSNNLTRRNSVAQITKTGKIEQRKNSPPKLSIHIHKYANIRMICPSCVSVPRNQVNFRV